MKKGYMRLLIFEFLILVVLLLNSFVVNILPGYKMILFLLLITILFWKLFGIEKDRHRYVKDILLDTVIFLFTFFILYYLLGLLVGFTKPDNYYNFNSIKVYIIPAVLFVLFREFLRYNISCKASGSKICIVSTIILFIMLDITQTIRITNFNSNYEILTFLSYTILPSISSNIVLTYITLKVGYKPTMLYSEIMRLYRYLIPILPNPNPYIYSIIMLVLPTIFGFKIYSFYKKEKDEEISRKYNKKRFGVLLVMIIPIIIMVYFVSGYFRFHAVAIGSGSMTPNIYKGDIVIIDKKFNFDDLKEGQVIAFRKNGILIVHRLVKKYKIDDEYIMYTKGDANEEIDNFFTTEKEVYGIVNYSIPYIGLPTVWFNKN